MGNIFQDRFRNSQPLFLQVQGEIRKMISCGDLPSGRRLPPSSELARQLGTSTHTVHTALTGLVKEGLLERRQKSGTSVKGKEARLSCVGLFYGRDFWSLPENDYYIRLHQVLERQLADEGVECRIWIESSTTKRSSFVGPIATAVRNRQVQAIISPSGGEYLEDIKEFGIPFAIHSVIESPWTVCTDISQMQRLALQWMKDSGCETAGVISQYGRGAKWFYDDFQSYAQGLGIRLRPEWILANDQAAPNMTALGDIQFRRLWGMKKKPDGLFVYHDINARGVINAMSHLDVKSPEDIKLIVHHNIEVPFHQPFPLMTAAISVEEVAAAMIRQIHIQMRGETPQHILLPYHLHEVKGYA